MASSRCFSDADLSVFGRLGFLQLLGPRGLGQPSGGLVVLLHLFKLIGQPVALALHVAQGLGHRQLASHFLRLQLAL